jgi:hypothetical protein
VYTVKVAFTQEVNPDFISRAVMWALEKPYSHVLILFEDVDGKEKILHAIGKGTCIDEDKEYLKTHNIVRMYEVQMRVSREVFSGYARGRVGRDYAETNYINMALEMMGVKWVPFKNGNSDVVCSSEVAAIGPLSKLELPDGMIWRDVRLELVDPVEVDEFLFKNKKARLIS